MEQLASYPLKDCESCIHKHVCKWQELFINLLESGAPLDASTTGCTAYIPDTAMDEMDEDVVEVSPDNVQEAIDAIVEQYYKANMVPNSIFMGKDTFNSLKDDLKWESKGPKGGAKGDTTISIITSRGPLEVVFSESVPDGSFYITSVC